MKIEVEVSETVVDSVIREDGKTLLHNINTELRNIIRNGEVGDHNLSNLADMLQDLNQINHLLKYYGRDPIELKTFDAEGEADDELGKIDELDNKVYDRQEVRVCKYLTSIMPDIGCGVDPVGFLIASHTSLREKIERLKNGKPSEDTVLEYLKTAFPEQPTFDDPITILIGSHKIMKEDLHRVNNVLKETKEKYNALEEDYNKMSKAYSNASWAIENSRN